MHESLRGIVPVLSATGLLLAADPLHAFGRIFHDGFDPLPLAGCGAVAPAVPAGLTPYSPFVDAAQAEVRTRGIWALWWYPAFDHATAAEAALDRLEATRCNALGALGMRDPPNPGRGRYYNVYVHHGSADPFPDAWGNGQGTDVEGNPFLTLPADLLGDTINLDHEGLHVFQFSATSPGFAYVGDSAWYSEASAQWYTAARAPLGERTFVQVGTLVANPHLALWHGWTNAAPGDPLDWNHQVRQYGMHALLYYLTAYADVPPSTITDGFYRGTASTPQALLFAQIGAASLRERFADWAALNTAGFPYLTAPQVAAAQQEIAIYGDPATAHPFAAELAASGTGGVLLRPPAALEPRGWAYNVIRVATPTAGAYAIALQGDATGSEGAASHFDARVVVTTPAGAQYTRLAMGSAQVGTGTVTVPAGSAALYLVVVATPAHFTGNQRYGYAYSIAPVP